MFNNGLGGFNPNSFNTPSHNLQTGNIAGLNKNPSNVAGVNNGHHNLAGMSKMPRRQNPFKSVYRDNSGPAKQVMNSQGQNIFHNDARGIKN